MAISFERQRRVIVKNYTENNGDNPLELEDPNVTISESEYIDGVPTITGTKDTKAMEKMIYTYAKKAHEARWCVEYDGILEKVETIQNR